MKESPEQHLLGRVRRCGGLTARGLITGPEFINTALDEFAYADRVYPEIIPGLWDGVPEGVRGAFEEVIRNAALPGFHYGPFYIGGDRPMTEGELRRDAELRTARVRTWAMEFVRWLDEVR